MLRFSDARNFGRTLTGLALIAGPLIIVNNAINAQATACAPPNLKANVPDPMAICAFACFTPGKK